MAMRRYCLHRLLRMKHRLHWTGFVKSTTQVIGNMELEPLIAHFDIHS